MTAELPGEAFATPLSRPFWSGLHAGRLVLQRCPECGHWQHYPRRLCGACWRSSPLRFDPVTGTGELLAAALSHRTPKPELRDHLPMMLALVRLTEGPTLLARLMPAPEPASGAPVHFDPAETVRSGLLSFTFPPTPTEEI